MSSNDRLSPGLNGGGVHQRPTNVSSSSSYFSYTPATPSPTGVTFRTRGGPMTSSDGRLSPGGRGVTREARSQSISSTLHGRLSRRNTQDNFDFDRESVGFSEAEEDSAAAGTNPTDNDDSRERRRDEIGEDEDEDEDEDSPSPTAEDMGAIRASREYNEDDPMTLKDRQLLLNAEHPFGLPIWKPALYKKSRTVTRNAESALHGVPGATEMHLSLGNILWTLLFGWWLALICIVLSLPLWVLEFLVDPAKRHASVVFGLGWYLFFPFGKYVEGDLELLGRNYRANGDELSDAENEDNEIDSNTPTINHRNRVNRESQSTIRSPDRNDSYNSMLNDSWDVPDENSALIGSNSYRSYGAAPFNSFASVVRGKVPAPSSQIGSWVANGLFWIFMVLIITPLLLVTSAACWAMIFPIPMAKLSWELLTHLFTHPLALRFRRCPPPVVVPQEIPDGASGAERNGSGFTIKRTRIAIGNPAPSGRPCSTVLLCVYKAMGLQYYKYTVGGVNILFVNTLPVVFLVILDGFFLLPWVEKREHQGHHINPLINALANRGVIFVASLTSVIPLSYFIGMAVASISAQSSIGMGAVINASFGSIIEIILYSIALTQWKGALVEGSLVGSILAGVLLMPGLSMISSALKKKESKFNAKSASVTSTMLVMAMIGVLSPTIFYQTYGNFELRCDGCPTRYPSELNATHEYDRVTLKPWTCHHCYYEHTDPATDEFYQTTVKPFMYFCACILVLSYLVGLWFSLRTHASQIWSNPQKLLHPLENQPARSSIYQRLVSGNVSTLGHSQAPSLPTYHTSHSLENSKSNLRRKASKSSRASLREGQSGRVTPTQEQFSRGPSLTRRASQGPGMQKTNIMTPYSPSMYAPIIESVDQAVRSTNSGSNVLDLPQHLSTEEFARAVTVATVSALRHPQTISASAPGKAARAVIPAHYPHHELEASGAGDAHGHGGPSWSRTTSASVLLCCTVLYALIAEILVDVVDVVLEGSGIDEKFLGITLFALVPNTTEFMNAMSFAINGNISLSMEIGSAYALQVCLLQIPAMVAFSAWWDPDRMGRAVDTFTLIFPRWDVIVIILAIFLLTYTYIEARSNYHRGSILILSYLVLVAGFYFAPARGIDDEAVTFPPTSEYPSRSLTQMVINTLWAR